MKTYIAIMAGLNPRVEGEVREILDDKRVRYLTPATRLQEDLRAFDRFVRSQGANLWSRMQSNSMTQADAVVVTAAMVIGETILSRLPRPHAKVTVHHTQAR